MRRRALTAAALGICLLAGVLGWTPARGEHFDIVMTLRGSQGGFAEATWDTAPPEGGLKPRQVLTAAAGEDLTLEWRLRSEFPHGVMKGVVIRIWAAPEREIGQKNLPDPGAPRVFENSFTADFLPHHSARGVFHFRVTEPGSYLVRLQSELTQDEHAHEHFGALDLKVE